jgi:hypothetical protein
MCFTQVIAVSFQNRPSFLHTEESDGMLVAALDGGRIKEDSDGDGGHSSYRATVRLERFANDRSGSRQT